MIIFLNFAPIEFMGGAERWMYKIKEAVKAGEGAQIVCLSPNVANIYGKLVLGRKYDNRATNALTNIVSIGWSAFIPFSPGWKTVRDVFRESRVIYMRFEILEVLILVYFQGLKALRKSVAGVHSPLIYAKPVGFFDRLHKLVYESFLCQWILKKFNKVHVLNNRDKEFLEKQFGLTNVIMIPNGIEIPEVDLSQPSDPSKLRIIFVGELIVRKGVDVLCQVIQQSPPEFLFDIAGNGAMEKKIVKLAKQFPNVKYHGFLDKDKLQKLYEQNDVLFLPSKAESFSLVMLEAMACGLRVVVSNDVLLELPDFIQSRAGDAAGYLTIFNSFLKQKQMGFDRFRVRIRKFCEENFSENMITNQLLEKIFTKVVDT